MLRDLAGEFRGDGCSSSSRSNETTGLSFVWPVFAKQAEIPLLQPDTGIGADAVLAAVAAQRPDFIFSIDNFQIFGSALLGIARSGCINFHNGPIERYRGVHAPSWAIFNDEKEHGITWHYMERSVDAGAIAAEDRFALAGTETALSLTLECIRVGVNAFKRHLGSILAGDRTPAPGIADAKLYRRADLPDGGVLNLSRRLRTSAACFGPRTFDRSQIPSRMFV